MKTELPIRYNIKMMGITFDQGQVDALVHQNGKRKILLNLRNQIVAMASFKIYETTFSICDYMDSEGLRDQFNR